MLEFGSHRLLEINYDWHWICCNFWRNQVFSFCGTPKIFFEPKTSWKELAKCMKDKGLVLGCLKVLVTDGHLWLYTQRQNKRDDSEIYAFSLTLNISFNSLSNLAINDIFKICRPSRFQTCPWLFHLIKNRMRYLRLKRMHIFPNRLVNFDFGCSVQPKRNLSGYFRTNKGNKCRTRVVKSGQFLLVETDGFFP